MSQAINYSRTAKLAHSNASKTHLSPNYHQQSTQAINFQTILGQQRNKFLQIRETYEIQLSNQKKIRLEFENKLIRLKDQMLKKDMVIAELEFKQNSTLQDNQGLVIENQKLKNEIARLESAYTDRIFELETKLEIEGKSFDDATNQYMTEFEKFKKEGQEYIEALNYEYQKKINNLEERLRVADYNKKQLYSENKRLNETVVTNQLDFDTQLREAAKRMRNQDLKKSQMASKSFEQRYRGLEQNKEAVYRKNQQLMRSLQEKQKLLHDLEFDRNEEMNKLKQELDSLATKNEQIKNHYENIKNELREQHKTAPTSDNILDNSVHYKDQLNYKNQELNALKESLKGTKGELAEQRSAFEKKSVEQSERIKSLEGEAKKYKDEYTKICETLKLKINETINVVSKSR